jgi:hypothetical protein
LLPRAYRIKHDGHFDKLIEPAKCRDVFSVIILGRPKSHVVSLAGDLTPRHGINLLQFPAPRIRAAKDLIWWKLIIAPNKPSKMDLKKKKMAGNCGRQPCFSGLPRTVPQSQQMDEASCITNLPSTFCRFMVRQGAALPPGARSCRFVRTPHFLLTTRIPLLALAVTGQACGK